MKDPRPTIAADVCTPKELQAWQLRERGLSYWTIALALDLSVSTIRSRLRNSERKIEIAMRKDTAA